MNKEKLIDLDVKQLNLLKKTLKQHIPDKTVWAYGSRVNWKANETSDLDLTVFDSNSMEISALKEALEESNLLISVDIMNWEEIPENFRDNIKNKYVVLQETSKLEGWREVRLGDVLEVIGGGTPKTSITEYWDGDIPWLAPPDFVDTNRWVEKTKKSITQLGLKQSSTKLLHQGDVIISARGTVGALAQIKVSMAFSQSNYGLRAKNNFIGSDFLFYLVKSCIRNIKQFSYGTVFDTITTKTFNEVKIILPPLPEQKAIAEVLSSLDDKIDLLHRQNKTLEDMAQTLFRQWFIEEADEGWGSGKLGDILTVKGGTTPSTKNPEYWNGEIHWTTPKDLSNDCPMFLMNTLRKITEKGLDKIGSGLLPKETLLLSSRAPVGYMAFSAVPIAINQGYIAIIDDKGYSSLFIYSWLKLNMNYVKSFANGSTFQEISKTAFKSLEIVMPPKDKREEFDETIKPSFEKIFSNQSQISTLENLRDTLSPKLMNGEVQIR